MNVEKVKSSRHTSPPAVCNAAAAAATATWPLLLQQPQRLLLLLPPLLPLLLLLQQQQTTHCYNDDEDNYCLVPTPPYLPSTYLVTTTFQFTTLLHVLTELASSYHLLLLPTTDYSLLQLAAALRTAIPATTTAATTRITTRTTIISVDQDCRNDVCQSIMGKDNEDMLRFLLVREWFRFSPWGAGVDVLGFRQRSEVQEGRQIAQLLSS